MLLFNLIIYFSNASFSYPAAMDANDAIILVCAVVSI